jgi:hypothetical protein
LVISKEKYLDKSREYSTMNCKYFIKTVLVTYMCIKRLQQAGHLTRMFVRGIPK